VEGDIWKGTEEIDVDAEKGCQNNPFFLSSQQVLTRTEEIDVDAEKGCQNNPFFLSSQQVLTRDIIVAANAHSIEILKYRMKKYVLQTCHLMVSTIIWHLKKFI